MKYRNSATDKKLRSWFANDYSNSHLRKIEIAQGSIRGLTTCTIPIDYPIIAIAGKNGAGKSTALALACCAYHNKKDGIKASNRKQAYYTFADFFIRHQNEPAPEEILIEYDFAYDNWKVTPEFPNKKEINSQVRYKSEGGKWNDYASRINRNVIFIGIERIVPHSEKSQSKSYRRYFKVGEPKGWEKDLGDIIGYILNKKYEDVKIARHSKYKLPLAKINGISLSGFNMGAGENALFEIFSTIYSAPKGSLIVIDEIELGLHIEAQSRFIRKLKETCIERQIQVICTTHSSEIFDYLPEDARVFIEKTNGKTICTLGHSSEYAFSKLSSENSNELCILVEDDVAQKLTTLILPAELRSRITIEIIGSASALSVQLASTYKRANSKKTIVLFDGDQKAKSKYNSNFAANTLEIKDPEFSDWFTLKTNYLPSDTWPESWIIETSKNSTKQLAAHLKTTEASLKDIIEYGLEAGKHNEFYEIGKHTSLTREEVLSLFCLNIAQNHATPFSTIIDMITNELAL